MSVTPEIGTRVLDGAATWRTVRRLAHEVIERHPDVDNVVIAGIRSGGVPLAAALVAAIDDLTGARRVQLAAIDVAGYRDDAPRAMARLRGTWAALPRRGDELPSQTAPAIDSAVIVLVDDVIQTGRTLRAALDAISAHGRPAAVESAALIDRGHRELPLRPTYVGKNLPVTADDWVHVRLDSSSADDDGAFLVKRQ